MAVGNDRLPQHVDLIEGLAEVRPDRRDDPRLCRRNLLEHVEQRVVFFQRDVVEVRVARRRAPWTRRRVGGAPGSFGSPPRRTRSQPGGPSGGTAMTEWPTLRRYIRYVHERLSSGGDPAIRSRPTGMEAIRPCSGGVWRPVADVPGNRWTPSEFLARRPLRRSAR